MIEYRLRVANTEVYEWTDEGEGKHIHNSGGFTLGHFKRIDDAKAELSSFLYGHPEYEAYEGEEFITWGRIEDRDGNQDNGGDYLGMYTIVLEKITPVLW